MYRIAQKICQKEQMVPESLCRRGLVQGEGRGGGGGRHGGGPHLVAGHLLHLVDLLPGVEAHLELAEQSLETGSQGEPCIQV